MENKSKVTAKMTTEWWASPQEGKTLDELIERLISLGNPIIEIDRDNNRVKINNTEDTVLEIKN